jgi:hypothetical protein
MPPLNVWLRQPAVKPGPKTPAPGSVVRTSLVLLVAALLGRPAVLAQANLTIYSDSLASGWLDYSYGTTRNFANPSPVHSGSASISATITNAYGGISTVSLADDQLRLRLCQLLA